MAMELISRELAGTIPRPGTSQGQPPEKRMVYARLVDPGGSWTWYVLEFDGDDSCLGVVVAGSQAAWGRFTLEELRNIHPAPLADPDFEPRPLGELALSEAPIRHWLESEIERDGLVTLEK